MILVTGGAGYIGSHVVKQLITFDNEVVVIDNLSTGNMGAIDQKAHFIKGDIRSISDLSNLFQSYKFKAVVHLAAKAYVKESVEDPLKYYDNNVIGTINLLNQMRNQHIRNLVFSSSCAVYGTPKTQPITENTPLIPINPYGHSKNMCEQCIRDYANSSSLNYIILRFFNVAGASKEGVLGEAHKPETHLIPSILKQLHESKGKFNIYGDDYPTPDGSCIRDFIDVDDLARAHILAIQSLLLKKNTRHIFNIGNEKGYSVKEVIEVCEKVANKKVNVQTLDRRPNEPPELIASAKRIRSHLGWKPIHNLHDIVESAWKWHIAHPHGFDQ